MYCIANIVLFFGLFLFRVVQSACPNACSGHGSCDAGNACACFEGWDGGAADCSSSIFYLFLEYCIFIFILLYCTFLGECPKGVAWADKAYSNDIAHSLAVCSNAGVCDSVSGLCKCFAGYSGSACQRS